MFPRTLFPATAFSPLVFPSAAGIARPRRSVAFWGPASTPIAAWSVAAAAVQAWSLSFSSAVWGFTMATTLGLEMYRGEDRLWTFVPVRGAVGEDITGWTLVANFWNQATPPALVLTKTTANGGIVITNATPGYFTLAISHADTAGNNPLPDGVYPADIWRTDSGSQRALALGALTLLPSPSH